MTFKTFCFSALTALTIAGCSPCFARQLGQDPQPQLYKSYPITDPASCEADLARHLWQMPNKANPKQVVPFNPSSKVVTPGDLQISHIIVANDCKDTAKDKAPTLPVLVHAAVWVRSGGTGGTFAMTTSEWQVFHQNVQKDPDQGGAQGASSRSVLVQDGYHRSSSEAAAKDIFESKSPLYSANRIKFVGMNCFVDEKDAPSRRMKSEIFP